MAKSIKNTKIFKNIYVKKFIFMHFFLYISAIIIILFPKYKYRSYNAKNEFRQIRWSFSQTYAVGWNFTLY